MREKSGEWRAERERDVCAVFRASHFSACDFACEPSVAGVPVYESVLYYALHSGCLRDVSHTLTTCKLPIPFVFCCRFFSSSIRFGRRFVCAHCQGKYCIIESIELESYRLRMFYEAIHYRLMYNKTEVIHRRRLRSEERRTERTGERFSRLLYVFG